MKRKIGLSDGIYKAVETYLDDAVNTEVAAWNTEKPGLGLPELRVFRRGYREIVGASATYPVCITNNPKREDDGDGFFSLWDMGVWVGLKSDDMDQLESWGEAYKDILHYVFQDNHLGGACQDTTDIVIHDDVVSGVYVILVEFTMTVALGGTCGKEG